MSNTERWSWPSLAALKDAGPDYSDFMRESEVSQLVHSVSHSNVATSNVLRQKFLFLRLAFASATVALALLLLKTSTFM